MARTQSVDKTRQTVGFEYASFSESFTNNMSHVRAEQYMKFPSTYTHFDYLKYYAIERIERTFAQQIQLMYKISECNYREPMSELSKNVFSWEMKHYVERRAHADQTFVKVLKKIPENCLEMYKFKFDLIQLLNFVTLIFDGIYSNMGHIKLTVCTHVEKPLHDTRALILRNAFMEDEYKRNVSNYTVLVNSRWLTSMGDEVAEQKQMKANLQSKLLYRHILDPIQLRYTINWYKNKLDEKAEKMQMVEDNLSNGIENYSILLQRETQSTTNCTEFLFDYIDQLKNEIAKMQVKYEVDVDNIDNELISKHLQIEKLRDQHRFLKDEIKRFHEEIDEVRNSTVSEKRGTPTLKKKRSTASSKKSS